MALISVKMLPRDFAKKSRCATGHSTPIESRSRRPISRPEPVALCRGRGEALDGLYVAGKQAAGLIDIARPQRLKNQAMVLVGPWPPAGIARHRKHKPGVRKLQPVEAGKQPRHAA